MVAGGEGGAGDTGTTRDRALTGHTAPEWVRCVAQLLRSLVRASVSLTVTGRVRQTCALARGHRPLCPRSRASWTRSWCWSSCAATACWRASASAARASPTASSSRSSGSGERGWARGGAGWPPQRYLLREALGPGTPLSPGGLCAVGEQCPTQWLPIQSHGEPRDLGMFGTRDAEA